MSNINTYLQSELPKLNEDKVLMSPGIPEKKLNNAAKAFDMADSLNMIIGIYDNTLMGSAKSGVLFTGEKLVIKEDFEKSKSIEYDNIENVTIEMQGKKQDKPVPVLKLKDKTEAEIKGMLWLNPEAFKDMMLHVIENFDEYHEEDQLLALTEMSEELRMAYVKVIINMAFDDDGVIDEKELSEILSLMTRLNFTSESRLELRGYASNSDAAGFSPVAELLHIINSECAESQRKSVHISLVKDLISVYKSTSDGDLSKFTYLNNYRELFEVSTEEIELAEMAIDNDRKMLDENYDDNAIEKSVKELAAKAGAVGVPLGAVYISGSVMGMSAAGMTSGLASMGMGGALGLSSMATGIGVAVLIGVGAYKGMQHLTGANELDKNKRRQIMLLEVIKQTQRTLSELMEDINHLTSGLNDAILKGDQQGEKIKRLGMLLSQYVKAGQVVSNKSQAMQRSEAKVRSPMNLDLNKLKSLTTEATKKSVYDFIVGSYEEVLVKVEKDGGVVEEKQLRLKPTLSRGDLDQLGEMFKAIGYFDMASVAKGKLKGMFS
jgi:hypothetical protein